MYKKSRKLLKLQHAVLYAVTEMVELRDGQTFLHLERTRQYLQILVRELIARGAYREEMHNWDLKLLFAAAPLHDLGKIAISDSILKKPGKLTEDEFEIMKKHVVYGLDAIESIRINADGNTFFDYILAIVGAHHEKWDGSGYPKGLKGQNIPLAGRLMAIADVYDALISDRPYKAAVSHREATRIISEGRGNHFDPLLVDAFLKVSGDFAALSGRDACRDDTPSGQFAPCLPAAVF